MVAGFAAAQVNSTNWLAERQEMLGTAGVVGDGGVLVDGAASRVFTQMTNVRKLTLPEQRIRPFIS